MVLFLCVAYNAARGVKQSGRPVRTCPLHKLLLAWAAKPTVPGATAKLDERRGIYAEIEEIVAKDLPYWWLVETDFTSAYRDSLHDVAPWTGQLAERAWIKR